MKKRKVNRGIEHLKSRYGLLFVTPWCVGLIIFFAIPIIQSIFFSFANITLGSTGIESEFVKIENYKYLFTQDAYFIDNIVSSLTNFAYTFPLIIILSFVLALVLNEEFRGRTFFRALYFTPVIIASGSVITLMLTMTTTDVESMAGQNSQLTQLIQVDDVLNMLGLPSSISKYLNSIVSSIMNILWDCGIQIILFIAGMQSIPDLYYEVSKVEGATKWETLWFITIPSLFRVILLVAVFTAIELMTDEGNPVMNGAYVFLQTQRYGIGNAMLWSYFVGILAILGVVLVGYSAAERRWGE